MINKQALIAKLDLKPHPEGGFFKRTCTTKKNDTGQRLLSTCIYFLIEYQHPSSLHKLDVDEYWMYHCGTSDIIIQGFSMDQGEALTIRMGNECMQWQSLIPKNTWFGARTIDESKDAYALVSCICTPGFDFSGFTLGDKNALLSLYPEHKKLIEEMSINNSY